MIPFSNRFLLIFRHNIYLQLLLDYYYLFELSFYSTINKSIIFGDENKKRCFCLQLYEDMLQRSTDVDEFISIVSPVDENIIKIDRKNFCLLCDIDPVIISDIIYLLK